MSSYLIYFNEYDIQSCSKRNNNEKYFTNISTKKNLQDRLTVTTNSLKERKI